MERYIIGISSIVGLMLLWAGVQYLWKKIFPEHVVDHDALAGRSDCGNCGCTTACSVKQKMNSKN